MRLFLKLALSDMQKTTVICHFGDVSKAAKAVGVSQAAVSKWGEVIPEKQAFRIERITKGALVYDPSIYEKTA